MIEIQHPPGLWWAQRWSCHAATSVLVADASDVTGKRLIAEFETEEDARLGAAAPEMLKALESVVRQIEPLLHKQGYAYVGAIEAARAAIAKATGA